MKAKFPHILKGSSPIKVAVPSENDMYLAVASLDKLKSFLPEIDFEKNYDLLGISFNCFVANRANKNGQVISGKDAIECAAGFISRPFNIEHARQDIIGFCTNYGFSAFGSDKPLTLDDVKDKKEPFNVVLGGIIWKVNNPEFAEELIEASDPDSKKYLSISASWEIGFRDFNIAKGSKNLADCEIISDEKEIEKIKDNLQFYGGSGMYEDEPIFLNVIGEKLPLGVGLTGSPAAAVAGVQTSEETPEVVIDASVEGTSLSEILSIDPKLAASTTELSNSINNLSKSQEKSSQLEKPDVTNSTTTIMKIKNISDITNESLKTLEASAISEFIQNEIKTKSDEWVSQKAKDDAALEAAKTEANAEKEKATTLQATVDSLKAELDTLKAEQAARVAEATFQTRIQSLQAEYDLSDEDTQLVASDIKDLDEPGYTKWSKSFAVYAKSKKKTQVATASTDKTVTQVLNAAPLVTPSIPNATTPETPSLKEKMKDAFSLKNLVITK